jgi:V8-like Glu-specific endopeptidase
MSVKFRRAASLAVLGFGLTVAAGAQRLVEGRVESVTIEVSQFHAPDSGVVWSSPRLGHADARYLRVHLASISDIGSTPFSIEISDDQGMLVERLTREILAGRTGIWSSVVQGGALYVKVVAEAPPTGLHFAIDAIAWGTEPAAQLSIIGLDRREQLYQVNDPAIRRAAAAVAKLSLIIDDELASCTGFLISPQRMLTNEHCIDSQQVCDAAVALFGYEKKDATTLLPGKGYHCAKLLQVDPNLDYALIELQGEPGNDGFGWLSLTPRQVAQGEELVLIQHPGGEPKQISRRGCKVRTAKAAGTQTALTDLGHTCDTVQGSSGSPVLDSQMRVVGLHHFGTESPGRWAHENRAVRCEVFQPFLTPEGVVGGTP